MSITELGKAVALAALARRRANKPEQIANHKLPAGSPMYFYCISCGGVSDVMPEGYLDRPRKLCIECDNLKTMGWLE